MCILLEYTEVIWFSESKKGLLPSMSRNLGFEDTDSILIEERLFTPPTDVVENVNITAYMRSKGFDNTRLRKRPGVVNSFLKA
jgi:hypothetical protein